MFKGDRGMESKIFTFNELEDANLYIDAVYSSPRPCKGNYGDDVLNKLLYNIQNEGGFRIAKRRNKSIAYLVLQLSGYEPAWPDDYDTETGILTYYGDNRKVGRNVEETAKGGNKLLREMFENLELGGESLKKIPPILVFQKTGEIRDVRFLGLAVPGVKDVNKDDYFKTIWRTSEGSRFPNYMAKFTIIDIEEENIDKQWLHSLLNDSDNSNKYMPKAWKSFLKKGLAGIKPLAAPNIADWPGDKEQLPNDDEGMKIIKAIHRRYAKNDTIGFEKFSKALMYIMDSHYSNIDLTRPWRDGGRDATAEYIIETPTNKLVVECAMEAKCYEPSKKHGVGVKHTSRLISRIKNRQFGILITTSYISKQAYLEVKQDGHPILFCTGRDIAKILQYKENVTSATRK